MIKLIFSDGKYHDQILDMDLFNPTIEIIPLSKVILPVQFRSDYIRNNHDEARMTIKKYLISLFDATLDKAIDSMLEELLK